MSHWGDHSCSSGASSQHCLCVCFSASVCMCHHSPLTAHLPVHNPSPSSTSLPKSPDTLNMFLSLPTTLSSYLPHTTSFLHLSSSYPSLHLIIPSKLPFICQKQHHHTVHPTTNSWVCMWGRVGVNEVVWCVWPVQNTHTHTTWPCKLPTHIL